MKFILIYSSSAPDAPIRRRAVQDAISAPRSSRPLIFPGEDVGEIFVVAQRFAICCLMFLAEMSAARFVAGQRVTTHQFAELEKISDASGALE